MQLKSIQVQNLGPIEDKIITINKPLTVILGQPEVGKSTILKAVVWAGGGEFPDDILRHGCEEGFVELVFDRATIRREFYRSKDKSTKARPLEFVLDNQVQKSPVEKVQALLNPFILDPKFFEKKNEKDRRLYLIEVLGVDTSAEDKEISELTKTAQNMRQCVDRLGERTAVAPCEAPDTPTLLAQKDKAIADWQTGLRAAQARKQEINTNDLRLKELGRSVVTAHMRGQEQADDLAKLTAEAETTAMGDVRAEYDKIRMEARQKAEAEIKVIEARLAKELQNTEGLCEAALRGTKSRFEMGRANAQKGIDRANAEIEELQNQIIVVPVLEPIAEPVLDTTDIDSMIAAAGQQQANHLAYVAYKTWQTDKNNAQANLRQAVTQLEEKREAKRKKLAELADTCPIKGMTFDTDGNPVFEGTTMDMLSDSQAQRLSSAIAALYPEGIGLEIVDGGERFGKRIVEYVDYALANKRNVLMSVVGDTLAVDNDGIGVFVIEGNKEG
jgi:hypothetical protein